MVRQKLFFTETWNDNDFDIIKVAEHSFHVPMLNSPLLLNYSFSLFSHFGYGVCCCHGNGAG